MIRSIRTKVIISMMSLVILSGMFLGYVNYMDSEKLAIDIIKRNNKAELENINEYYFEKLIFDMEYIVEAWANNPQITNYVKSDDNHYVRSIPEDFINIYEKWLGLTESMKNVTWLYYALEEDGSIYIAPVDETMPLDYDARSRDWYKGTANKHGEIFWTEPYIDAGDSGKLLQTVSKAVYKDNKLRGVVGLDIELEKFTEIIEGLSYSKQSNIFLLNEKLEVLASNENAPENLSIYAKKAVSGEQELFTLDKIQYVSTYVPISINNWKLVALTQTNLNEELNSIRDRILTIVLLTILLGIIMSLILSRNLLKPLRSLILTTEKVSDGDFKVRSTITSNDEFSVLSMSFNSMLDDIENLIAQRDENYIKTVTVLANAIEASDEYTRGHCDRVGDIALQIANKLNLTSKQKNDLRFACILHDVGKIGISDRILNKPGSLTDAEYEIIKKHPEIGFEIIKEIDFLEEPANIMLEHHERIDGRGYPQGLKDEDIRIEAKILAVADTYDSISSARVYRDRIFTKDEIREELLKSIGTQLDEEVVIALLEILEDDMKN